MCPLHPGKSRKVIGENISEMEESGHKPSQSIAASLNEARKSGAHIPKKHPTKTHMHSHAKHHGEHHRHHGSGRG